MAHKIKNKKPQSKNIRLGGKYKVTQAFIERMCGDIKINNEKLVAEVIRERKNAVIIKLNYKIPALLELRDEFTVMRMDFDEYLIPIKDKRIKN
jgi:hypothetical protein